MAFSLAIWKTILFAVLVKLSHCQLDPDEYIIDVSATCPGSIEDGPATILVTTDLPSSKPFALCKNGEFPFLKHKMGNWSLSIYFDLNHTRECIFNQKSESAGIFSVSVYVPLSDNVITINVPEKIVNCIYDPVGDEISDMQTLGESDRPVKQITQHRAEPSTSRINICIADVGGNCMTESVRIGKLIMIKAMLQSNSSDEQGFQTLACSAVGPGYKLPLLIGGCGDGNVIPKTMGFTTTGKVAKSPMFKAFRVPGGNTLTYDCSFVVCSQPCDGSSCNVTSSARKKRDTMAVREKSFQDTIRIPKSDVLDISGVRNKDGNEIEPVEKSIDDSLKIDNIIKNKHKKDSVAIAKGNKNKSPKFQFPSTVNSKESLGKVVFRDTKSTAHKDTGESLQNRENAGLNQNKDEEILKLKREVEQTRALWKMETILVLLLAVFGMIFMAVTVKLLLSLMGSLNELKTNLTLNTP